MDEHFYPEIDEWALQVVLENIQTNPGYLADPECPYSADVRALFSKRSTSDEEVDLEAETRTLFNELRIYKDGLSIDDHSESMSYFRTATSLLEKLVAMQERAHNVRQVSRFYEAVMGVLDRYLTPEQITEFRTQLGEL